MPRAGADTSGSSDDRDGSIARASWVADLPLFDLDR